MKKTDQHIVIVRTTRSEFSSMGRESSDAIVAALARHYAEVSVVIINDASDLMTIVAARPDIVFLGMKFIPSDTSLGIQDPNPIWLGDFLDEHEIVYTGSGADAHRFEANKHHAKQQVLDAGLDTSRFCVIEQDQAHNTVVLPLTFPLFVKPTNRGGGQGIDSNSVVENIEQLAAKVRAITLEHQADSLVEEYLPGREFSVAVLKDEDSAQLTVMPVEMIAPLDARGSRLLTKDVKTANTETVVAVAAGTVRDEVIALARDVFQALGARDYGRFDIRLDANGTPHFLEANLLPSLISGYGSFPKSCQMNMGLDHESMILAIVRLAVLRKQEKDMRIAEAEADIGPYLSPVFEPIV